MDDNNHHDNKLIIIIIIIIIIRMSLVKKSTSRSKIKILSRLSLVMMESDVIG